MIEETIVQFYHNHLAYPLDKSKVIRGNRVHFDDKPDEHLLEKITTEEELSVYLNQCVSGLQKLMKQGKFDDKYYDWIGVKDL